MMKWYGRPLCVSCHGADRSIMSITGSIKLRMWQRRSQQLVPEANVAFAHGQMQEKQLGTDHV